MRKRGRRRGRVRAVVWLVAQGTMSCGVDGWVGCARSQKHAATAAEHVSAFYLASETRLLGHVSNKDEFLSQEGKEGKKERMSKTWAVTHTQRPDTAHRKAQHGVM